MMERTLLSFASGTMTGYCPAHNMLLLGLLGVWPTGHDIRVLGTPGGCSLAIELPRALADTDRCRRRLLLLLRMAMPDATFSMREGDSNGNYWRLICALPDR